MNFLQFIIYGNALYWWLWALGVVLLALFALRHIKHFGIKKLGQIAQETHTQLDDMLVEFLKTTKWFFLLIIALFIGAHLLTLPARFWLVANSLTVIALILQVGLWLSTGSRILVEHEKERKLKVDPASVTTIHAIGILARVVLWSIVLLLVLDNLGVNVTALIAGLGVGGIAVALALQNVLGDLFASLSIVLDKPFGVGDFLVIDDYIGSVEYVGLKTTRIRSLSGEQIILSNADLLKSRIRNYGRMFERRVAFGLGVSYQTTRENLRKIPQIIQAAVEEHELTRFDRSHFYEYGDFSLKFDTVYYVLCPDFMDHRNIQQAINLRLHEQFEKNAIEFAYPTQTLYLARGQNKTS